MDNFNTTVLIPVHIYNDTVKGLLTDAIRSVTYEGYSPVTPEKVAVVCPPTIVEDIKANHDVDVLVNEGSTDFCSQINEGAKQVETKYFTILEFDDRFTRNALLHVKEFSDARGFANSNIILPLVTIVKDNRELFIANNGAWAQEFTTKLGFIDHKVVTEHDVFILSGATMDTQKFLEIGGLKGDIKLMFAKEFLMRATHFGLVVSVAPKLGMIHTVGREGSLFESYRKDGLVNEEIAHIDALIKKGEYKNKESKFKQYSSNTEG